MSHEHIPTVPEFNDKGEAMTKEDIQRYQYKPRPYTPEMEAARDELEAAVKARREAQERYLNALENARVARIPVLHMARIVGTSEAAVRMYIQRNITKVRAQR